MALAKNFLRFANGLLTAVVVLSLSICGAYAAYALWDNSQIYSAAGNVQADMLRLKPVTESGSGAAGPSFAQLQAVNRDVCAWVTLDNTHVDYPVLQGETNLTYINTDVYGNFALAGSIYLDIRNDPNFTSPYSLLYGHHMEGGKMFGDLDLYRDSTFFRENQTGTLITPEKTYRLTVFACLLVPASEDNIFDPDQWQDSLDPLLDYVEAHAKPLRLNTLNDLRTAEDPRILAFSTCATDFSNARTIVLAVIHP